jgi:hypothetical protein
MISESDVQALLDRVGTRITDIETTSNTLFERSNLALDLLPAALTGDLHDTLAGLRDTLADLLAQLGKILANPGWPPGLFAAADTWTTAVGGPASAMSPKLGTDQLRIDTFWQGPAATAYTATLPAQRKALEAIKQATDILDSALTKIATGIIAMWIGIACTLASFLLELGTESAAAATVVGAPPAAAAAGLSTAKVVALVTAICGAFAPYLYLVSDSMAILRQTLWADSAFPNSRWPRSTTADFSDGSLSDGDTTDWRINPHG